MNFSDDEKDILLKLVRSTIEAKLQGGAAGEAKPLEGLLAEKCGAFVTLHKDGRLRGCIGLLQSDEPLYKTISGMALSAAFEDSRFPAVSKDELEEIDIEISVLSPLLHLKDVMDPEAVKIGKHGIYLTDGIKSGVLLPQVAVDQGFDRLMFLEQTSLKAGLDPDAWKGDAEVYVFTADIFGEKN